MKCRICEKETEAFLRIPTQDLDEPFLHGTLRRQLPELRLRRCPACGCLWADDARQDDAVLAEAYAQVSDSYFDSQEGDARYTRFYERLERALQRHVSGRTILDVGCGDGVFATLDTVNTHYSTDLISALDVIEHVVDPHSFVDSFKAQLRPGGFVLLLTGDVGSYPARVAGPHWSYLRWCGRVSVFSRSGLRRLLESPGFDVVHWQR